MDYKESDLSEQFLLPLADIPDPPESLWQIGALPKYEKRPKVVSIVGSRRCTKYGEDVAYRAAREFSLYGAIIVSGMAYGIDS